MVPGVVVPLDGPRSAAPERSSGPPGLSAAGAGLDSRRLEPWHHGQQLSSRSLESGSRSFFDSKSQFR